MSYRLRPAAEADVEAIILHIATDNPGAAAGWLDDLEQKLRRLAYMPEIGMARDDIRPGMRMLAFGRYLILYRIEAQEVEVVRVLHGARRWRELLEQDRP